MDSWDVALFAVAGYIAIVSMVRLMLGRRGALAQQIQDELQRQQTKRGRASRPSRIVWPKPPLTQPATLAKKKA